MEIVQVEETKLLGVNLDRKLLCSKHIDATVAKMGEKSVHNKVLLCLLTTLSTRQVLQALVLSHLDYCSVVWSGATKRDLGKVQLAQNRAARLPLKCTQRANINNMHVNLSWLKAEERLTSSLLVFVRGIDMLNALNCLFKLLAHSSDIHTYPTRHATKGLFTVPKSRTDYGRHTVLHRAVTTWNSIPHQVTHASSRIRFKKTDKNTPYATAETVKRHTHRYRHAYAHTRVSVPTTVYCNIGVWWYYTFCIVDMWW